MAHDVTALAVVALLLPLPGVWTQATLPKHVQVGGVTLEYVDWDGSGRALGLVPGGCDTAFD